MTVSLNDTIWLTQAGHDRLRTELDNLTRNSASRGPEVEGRIRELHALLRRAEVGDRPDDGLVEPGMTITVAFEADTSPSTFLLAERSVSDPEVDVDIYPPTSPLGAAIIGKYPGDVFDYTTPTGARVSGRIVAAEPFRGAPVR